MSPLAQIVAVVVVGMVFLVRLLVALYQARTEREPQLRHAGRKGAR